MRYGLGDWRTGWMASPLADMLSATAGGLFTTPFHLDDKAPEQPGSWCRRVNLGKRPWRMTASEDGRVLTAVSPGTWAFPSGRPRRWPNHSNRSSMTCRSIGLDVSARNTPTSGTFG